MATTKDSPAAALLERRDTTAKAIDRIDKDPEEALVALEPSIKAAPNVGEITQADMFRLMTQMQSQMAAQGQQILELMGQRQQAPAASDRARELQAEVARDKEQRDNTLEAWRTEPREPVWIQPEQDEQKIHAVVGKYPPRLFCVNGLEFPVNVGEIVTVPSSIARLVEYTQRKRPHSRPPVAIEAINDPQRAQFLASAQSISLGTFGTAGQGPLQPSIPPPNPQPLGQMYDHRGQ